ncbi:ABC transporter substrate-binding protein [Paenarthrobacter sp. GOM3]|uniref:ABC transporter substrate-binding protein n=1 Tax=Paenarthrobacter sp. GOM3 TaxID=2782567 RepID=UPI001BA8DF58|nr:ABC transporter substrate-binding protein [Paenarthrobacter sp. GOM3]WOH19536.1 ABC transporter substrate-binding protein [Paenarthrobacter sp. GOM3]
MHISHYAGLRRGSVAVTTGLIIIAAIAGCTSKAVQPTTTGGSELTTLTPGGGSDVDKITWNVFQGEPQTLDPFHAADYTPNMINSNMCESLLQQTPEFKIQPGLAKAYSNPDPLTWVYDLRDDVTFWDGKPMTADDVAYSLNQNLSDKTSFYNYLYANVSSVAKSGDHQVTVTLSKPDYLFNEEMASTAGVVVEKAFHEQAGKKFGSPDSGLMCTGPYKFTKWTQGQSITASRFDEYWNKDLKPKVKQIDFTFLTDDNAITSGLLAGQIDGTYNVPTSGAAQLKSSSAGKYFVGAAPLETSLVVANPDGALANADVRKALQMAIDWKGIGQTVYGGLGTPSKLQTTQSAFGFAKDELGQLADSIPSDGTPQIEKAKALLANVPADVKAKEISLVVPAQAETQQLGVSIKDSAEKIGLKFNLNVVPATGYSNYLYDPATRGSTDLLYTQFWSNIPNPLDWLASTAVTGGTFNQSGYNGIDDLHAQAIGTKDPAERAKLVVQAETKLNDEMTPMFPGVELRNDVWMNNRISGAPAAFDYVYYPWAAHLGGTS